MKEWDRVSDKCREAREEVRREREIRSLGSGDRVTKRKSRERMRCNGTLAPVSGRQARSCREPEIGKVKTIIRYRRFG